MPMLSGSGSPFDGPPTLQAVIRQSSNLTQNQWYDAWTGLACAAGAGTVKRNVMIIAVSFDQAIADETIEIRVIADNMDTTVTQVATAGTDYYLLMFDDPDSAPGMYAYTTSGLGGRSFLFQAKACQIMYRKTSATGANATAIKTLLGLW